MSAAMDRVAIGLIGQSVRFSGEAGALQATGDVSGLLTELGGRYIHYHAELLAAWKASGRPDRKEFGSEEAYVAAVVEAERVVRSEVLLRKAVAWCRDGRSLDEALELDLPLLDHNDGLCSLDDAKSL